MAFVTYRVEDMITKDVYEEDLVTYHPPSSRDFNRRPQDYLMNDPKTSPLKSLATCCPHLRLVALPNIYKHATFTIGEWKDFLKFCTENSIKNVVETVNVVIDDSSEKAVGREYYSTYYVAFSKLLESLPSISSFVIRSSPADFHLLTGCHAYNVDAWTFNMPWHIFQLTLDPRDRRAANRTLTPAPVFEMLPWTGFSVNEGSFLKAYTQYEYFLRQPPTILVAARSSPGHEQLRTGFLQALRSFSYTAIFPFYNHIGNVLNLIETAMPNLHTLSICLAPYRDEYDSISAQETAQSSGKIDFHDAWMEFETSYELVAHVVQQLGFKARLRLFKSVDWTFGGEVRRIVEERITRRLDLWPSGYDVAEAESAFESLHPGERRIWQHAGGGVWKTEGKAAVDYPDAALPDPADLVV